MIELDTNNHSVFRLTYHLVLVVKYRRAVITEAIAERVFEIGKYIGNKYHITFLESNYEGNHVHILFKAHPNTQISKYLNAFKSASSRLVKKEFPQVRKRLWKEYFWSPSYCLVTTGGASLEVVKKYIQSQGKDDGK